MQVRRVPNRISDFHVAQVVVAMVALAFAAGMHQVNLGGHLKLGTKPRLRHSVDDMTLIVSAVELGVLDRHLLK